LKNEAEQMTKIAKKITEASKENFLNLML